MSLLLLFLPFFLTAASGANLQYGSTSLFDSPSMVALTVGMRVNVSCLQATGPVPTSIEWYNPQGQLVSNDSRDEVNQQVSGGDRVVRLNFRSYHQSQGGKYECRVAGPGNNTERLPVCIGERYTFLLTVKPETCDSGVFLVPSTTLVPWQPIFWWHVSEPFLRVSLTVVACSHGNYSCLCDIYSNPPCVVKYYVSSSDCCHQPLWTGGKLALSMKSHSLSLKPYLYMYICVLKQKTLADLSCALSLKPIKYECSGLHHTWWCETQWNTKHPAMLLHMQLCILYKSWWCTPLSAMIMFTISIHNISIVHRLQSSFVSSVSGLDYFIVLCKCICTSYIVVSVVREILDGCLGTSRGAAYA